MKIVLFIDDDFLAHYPDAAKQCVEYALKRSDHDTVTGVHLYGSHDRLGFLDAGVIVCNADNDGNFVRGQSLAVNAIRRAGSTIVEFVS